MSTTGQGHLRNARIAKDRAVAFFQSGHFSDARKSVMAAIALDPESPESHFVLGTIAEAEGDTIGAAEAYRCALEQNPAYTACWINLGRLLDRNGDGTGAAKCYDRALMLEPGNAIALNNLGELFHRSGDLVTARALLEAAISADPTLPISHFNLGRVHLAEHRLREAEHSFLLAYQLSGPIELQFVNAALLSRLCSPNECPDTLENLHRDWGTRFCSAINTSPHAGIKLREPYQPVNLGLISGDFNNHAASRFLEPVFRNLDRTKFRLFAYHTTLEEDEVTLQLKLTDTQWRNVAHWSTARLIDQIVADGIDILLDLSGHTRGNRLDVFARKPAPLQGEWLGYLHHSGLPTIDFRVSDPLMDSGGRHLEPLLPLKYGIWCYQPYPDCPEIQMEQRGHDQPFRFGSFNNPIKLNDEVVNCWAKILIGAPCSNLTLGGFNTPAGQHELIRKFAAHGVDGTRLSFWPKLPTRDYLGNLGRIDLALDPFPYAGGTTTFDSLWMGTSVLTLAGDRSCGRGTAAILTRLGLEEMIARNLNEYIDVATKIAHAGPPTLDQRLSLRSRLKNSPLTSGTNFCRILEDALLHRLHLQKSP